MSFRVQHLGVLEYAAALEIQHQVHAEVAQGGEAVLLLVEHPPVLTVGRKAGAAAHILAQPEYLANMGIAVHATERGGDVTYHGYGQVVGYPIFPVWKQPRDFLRKLEQVIIDTIASYGLSAYPSPGYAGVWVDQAKIAALGVAIRRNVALHGFALNVNTNLSHFDLIVPCGLSEIQVTSLAQLLAAPQDMQQVTDRLIASFAREFANYDWSLPNV